MIIPPSFFLILAILPTITEQAKPKYSSKESLILDWLDCGEYTGCFCYDDAGGIADLTEEPTGVLVSPPSDIDVGRCDIGIQSKFFNEDIMVLQFQIIGNLDAPVTNPTLILYQGTHKMFGCEYDLKTKKATLAGDTTMINRYGFSLFEDRSILEVKDGKWNYLCAIKISYYDLLISMMLNDATYKDFNAKISLMTSTAKDYSIYKIDFFKADRLTKPFGKCDTYSFQDLSSSAEFQVSPLTNRDKEVLSCPDTHTMRFEKGEEKEKIIGLKCAKNQNNDIRNLIMIEDKKDENEKFIERIITKEASSYTFYCAAPFAESCSVPEKLGCAQGTLNCPVYTAGEKGKNAALTCPDKKWVVKDELLVLTADATCELDHKHAQNSAAFTLTLESGNKVDVDGARCFTDYDCMKKSPITLPEKAELINGEIVKCKDPAIDLSILDYASNTTLTARSFTCDKASGAWKNTTSGAMTEAIASGSQITCPVDESKFNSKQESAKLTAPQMYGIIIGTGLAIFAITILIGFAVRYKVMHRTYKSLDANSFLKKTSAERLEHCRKFFPKAFKTSTTSTVQILNGLAELDMLLNLEIEDPEIWEVVYPFLMRFHGAITRIDHRIWHMFARYCYLRAKQIIDKHGWISPTPIRKSSPTGTIRAVAVRLLAFAICDPPNKGAAEKLLVKGYRKLQFKMDEQYPHCGVLLSLIGYARLRPCKGKKSADKKRKFDIGRFMIQLHNIAGNSVITIPEDEVIPAFGSVPQQAAFAMGSSPNVNYNIDICKNFTQSKTIDYKIVLSFFYGLLDSLYRSPAQPLILCFRLAEEANAIVKELLCEIAPERDLDKAIDLAMTIAVCYGRNLDAKKIEQRFKPKVTQPTAMLSELTSEQTEFELAMESKLDAIREWHAGHIDIEELKAKPAYATTDKFKADNCKEMVDKDAGDGCGSDKSASEARSVQGAPQSDVAGADAKSAVEGKSSASATPAAPEVKSAGSSVPSSASNDSKEKDPAAAKPEAAAAPPAADAAKAPAPPPSEPPASNPA